MKYKDVPELEFNRIYRQSIGDVFDSLTPRGKLENILAYAKIEAGNVLQIGRNPLYQCKRIETLFESAKKLVKQYPYLREAYEAGMNNALKCAYVKVAAVFESEDISESIELAKRTFRVLIEKIELSSQIN